MTAQHRFACVACDHRVYASAPDSETARQRARERGAAHVNRAHADRLARSPSWPDRLSPADLLTGEATFNGLHGWLRPVADSAVCPRCGYCADGGGDPECTAAECACPACRAASSRDRDRLLADSIAAFVR